MELTRSSGVLLHPTSLASPFGIGDLGAGAQAYLDFLAGAGVGWWQILPLNPPGAGASPYSASSSFAGNTLLVSPERLVEDGLLTAEEAVPAQRFPDRRVALEKVAVAKEALFARAFAHFRQAPPRGLEEQLAAFTRTHAGWLEDWALYAALKRAHNGAAWHQWPGELALRRDDAIRRWQAEHGDALAYERFVQFLFFRQWSGVRAAAAARGIRILGDVPIFVDYDSADVWAHRELFLLDEHGRRTAVAGVPPDYFSTTGQLWGNPLYRWDRMAEHGYDWWIRRLRHTLGLVDAVRLDHFRGFVAHWEVPAGEETAVHGRWVPGPGRDFFAAVGAALGGLPFVAEDLGYITDDVYQLRRALGLPGMIILQFAFNPSDRSTYLPYRHHRELVVYTGTHDNNTTRGWWEEDAAGDERDFARRYMSSDGHEIHWDMVRLAMASVARLAIVPHQDLVGLGSEARMNRPGVAEGNWRWRLTRAMLAPDIRERLAQLVWVYGRRGEG